MEEDKKKGGSEEERQRENKMTAVALVHFPNKGQAV